MPISKASSSAVAPGAKGDLVVGTTTNDSGILAVGSANQVLTVDSSTATGLKWATSSGWNPNYQLLNAGGTSLTGGAVTVTFTAKDSLFIFIENASNAAAAANNYIRFNSDTGSNYGQIVFRTNNADANISSVKDTSTSLIPICEPSSAGGDYSAYIWVYGSNSSGQKPIIFTSAFSALEANTARNGNCVYRGTSAITSITLTANGTTFDAGTIYVYGA